MNKVERGFIQEVPNCPNCSNYSGKTFFTNHSDMTWVFIPTPNSNFDGSIYLLCFEHFGKAMAFDFERFNE